jgi:hypothetical protein
MEKRRKKRDEESSEFGVQEAMVMTPKSGLPVTIHGNRKRSMDTIRKG